MNMQEITMPMSVPSSARSRAPISALLAVMLVLAGAGAVHADTRFVTTLADSGPGSLRQTIMDAQPGDTIKFAVTGTIVSRYLYIQNKELTIDGPGARVLAISGGGLGGVFVVLDSTVTIQGVTIRDGWHNTSLGAAVGVANSTLTLNNVTIADNEVDALGEGAGINSADSILSINNSTFTGNIAGDIGGAMVISNSVPEMTTTITNSTFSGNVAKDGAAVHSLFGSLSIRNSTFVGNSTTQATGGDVAGYGPFELKNSLFVRGVSGSNCSFQPQTVGGVNFSDDGTCGATLATPEALNLGPLADNGGPTMTHALLEGSVALDAATDCTDWEGQAVATDQRGVRRPQGLACDVGSFEREANTFAFTGFFAPVENQPTVNLVKAGSAVPVKFSLGGDYGLGILSGAPTAPAVACTPGNVTDGLTEVVSAGNSGLKFDTSTLVYTFVWKTDKAYAGTCRELQLKLTDGTVHTARFQFSK
jgi:hypothetical protein